MTAIRNPFTGKYTRLTPAMVAATATQNHKLALQRELVKARLEAAERVSPSRTRATQARRNGYRGPLTRTELAKAVQ